MSHFPACTLSITVARPDAPFMMRTIPHLVRSCGYPFAERVLIVDTAPLSDRYEGREGIVTLDGLRALCRHLVAAGVIDRVLEVDYTDDSRERVYRKHFAVPFPETHDYRGAPIFSYVFAIENAENDLILHFDSDILLHQDSGHDWIHEGTTLMGKVPEIVSVTPLSGPPTRDGRLKQGRTPYEWDPRGFYRFTRLTARKFLVDRRRLEAILPLTPLYKVARDSSEDPTLPRPGRAETWENMISQRLAETGTCRADLPTPKAWTLHTPDHGPAFIAALPDLIDKVERGWFPEEQAGDYDLRLELWNATESSVSSSEALDDWVIRRPGPSLSRASSVLAVVPHYRCEEWLGDCLDSLVSQTRPPDGIVVVDDASATPPADIVRHFPEVTLLTSTENVGPYRLIQQVIDETAYDAYMFQDADDWSMPNRLEIQLREAERCQAEMVGCQGYRLISSEGEVVPLTFPLDVNAYLARDPIRHAVKHPASIVSRDLVQRIGGFASGLRFQGDTEFQRRAAHVARVVNAPEFAYVYRNRANSLTSSPDTGLESPERMALREVQHRLAEENAALVAAGLRPSLAPMAVAPPVALIHVIGPRLCGVDGGTWPK